MTIPALVSALICLAAGAASAVTFTAELDRSTVPAGGRALLTVSLSAETSDLPEVRLPEIAGADVGGGGTSQNFRMVNGAVSVSRTWQWWIAPHGTDDVRIPQLTVEIDGRVHRTSALVLRVDGTAAPATPAPAEPAAPGDDRPASDQPGPGDDRFVTLSLIGDEAWVGEQLVLVFRYYESVSARGFDRPQYTPPRTEGFWRETLGETRTYRERRQGVLYNVSEIRYALIPTRPGELVVEPARVELPRDPFEDFFSVNRRGRGSGPRELWTGSERVTVRDLPSPRPEGFSGLVTRDLALTATLDRDTVPRGEAVSLTVELAADGSLKNAAPPVWDLPDDFTVHEAGSSLDQVPSGGRLRSVSRVERILQPRRDGDWNLPPVEMTYFDPARDAYRTARSAPLTLTVLPSDLPLDGSGTGSGRRGLERLAEDLAFVRDPGGLTAGRTRPLVETPLWWLALTSPIVLLAGWRLILARRDADMSDPGGRRRRLALVTARRALDAVNDGDTAVSLAAVHRAVLAYVADRIGRTTAAVGRGDMLDLAATAGREEAGRRLLAVLEACEHARYGSAPDDVQATALAAEAREAIVELDGGLGRGRKRRGPVASVLVPFLLLAAATGAEAASDPDRLVAEGVQAYTSGDLETARSLFEEAAGLTDAGDVAYDLGTVCARQGDLGPAVLHLKRALRADPRDGDARVNLDHVRSRIDGSGDEAGTPGILRLTGDLIASVRLDEWAWVCIVLVWVIAGGAAHAWWRGFVAVWHRRLLVAAAATLLVVGAVTAARWYDQRVAVHAVVVVDRTDVRSGPESSFPTLFEAYGGLELRIEEERGGWSQVTMGGEWRGWLPADHVVAVDIDHQERRR